jgi:hypothetical protein
VIAGVLDDQVAGRDHSANGCRLSDALLTAT